MYKSIRCYNKVLFQAPYGYGKTYVGIKWVLDLLSDDLIDLSVIFAPPTAIKTWIAKLTEVGLYKSDPEKSKVLVRHNSRTKHLKYFKDNIYLLSKGSLPELMPKIILCSCLPNIISDSNHLRIGCVQDECHRDYSEYVRKDIEENSIFDLKLTGTSCPNYNYKKIQTYEKREVENNTHITYVSEMDNGGDQLFRYIVSLVNVDTKMVICMPKTGTYYEHIIHNIKDTFGKRVFNLVGSEAAKNKFEKSTNGILLISIASSEAITICTPNVLVVNTDEISVQRLGQLFGRFTRAENLHESINITCITNNPVRTRYASVQLVSDWSKTFVLSIKRLDQFLIAFSALGIDYYTCERRDILIITHSHLMTPTEMVTYWENNKGPKTQLTAEKINTIYILKQ